MFLSIYSGMLNSAKGQEVENDVVYQFSLLDISHRTQAKPIQHALMENASIHSCEFIPSCECFKMATPLILDHAALSDLLFDLGQELTGPVNTSDGRTLILLFDGTEDR